MEIKQYTRILWRWSWLVIGLPAVVIALALLQPSAPAVTGYTANMRFSVGLAPEPVPSAYNYDRYYTWLTAEYLADDLTEVIKSQEIARAVLAEAKRRGLEVQLPPGAIQGATTGGKLHRILNVTVNWGNHDELVILADSLSTVLSEGRAGYFDQFRDAGTPIILHQIDAPTLSEVGPNTRQRLELPLRLMLAVFAGVSGAFVLDYLDGSVRDVSDLQARGIHVLGAIPRRSSLPWRNRHYR